MLSRLQTAQLKLSCLLRQFADSFKIFQSVSMKARSPTPKILEVGATVELWHGMAWNSTEIPPRMEHAMVHLSVRPSVRVVLTDRQWQLFPRELSNGFHDLQTVHFNFDETRTQPLHRAPVSSIRDSEVTCSDVSQFHGCANSTTKRMARVQFLHDPVAWNGTNLCKIPQSLSVKSHPLHAA
jgi:hypothetical protein